MRLRIFSPPDAAFAALLLLILTLLVLWGFVAREEEGAIWNRSRVRVRPAREVPPPDDLIVNPNRADARRLSTLPRIGPALADAVVRFRERQGPFRRLADLQDVPGIGPHRLQKMLPYLSLEKEMTWSTR
ncbi:MAG: ComEA family DNA-binding protein [Candidatus Methylomirabilales bacterium]